MDAIFGFSNIKILLDKKIPTMLQMGSERLRFGSSEVNDELLQRYTVHIKNVSAMDRVLPRIVFFI